MNQTRVGLVSLLAQHNGYDSGAEHIPFGVEVERAVFGLVVRFVCRDEEAAAAFDVLTAATLERIRAVEPETLLYVAHAVEGQPPQRIFYELYRDRAAFDVHEEQEHVKAFLSRRQEYIASFEVDFVTPVAGKGIGTEDRFNPCEHTN